MFRTSLFLAPALAAFALLLAAPDRAAAAVPRSFYRPPVRTPYYPPNRMPGWDWWRTYPWSPYNYGRNPYNPIRVPYYVPYYVPYAYPYPAPYPADTPSTPPGYAPDALGTGSGAAPTSPESEALIPHPVPRGVTPPADVGALRVRLPDAFADVRFDGQLASSMGYVRFYETPPLRRGKTYRYTVTATWAPPGGAKVTQERPVEVVPGHTTVVDFTRLARR
jgi:uncharacterized protein (TIGR03000 family)